MTWLVQWNEFGGGCIEGLIINNIMQGGFFGAPHGAFQMGDWVA